MNELLCHQLGLFMTSNAFCWHLCACIHLWSDKATFFQVVVSNCGWKRKQCNKKCTCWMQFDHILSSLGYVAPHWNCFHEMWTVLCFLGCLVFLWVVNNGWAYSSATRKFAESRSVNFVFCRVQFTFSPLIFHFLIT
jgi:hypothetical protein